MYSSDYQEFEALLCSMFEYYGKTASPTLISMYWNGLRDLDIESVRYAFNAHAQNTDTGQYMPKIADIRKMLTGTSADSALQAWSKVDRAVREVGVYRDVVFDDPLIHRVLHDMGGWIMLGSKKDSDWPFVEKEFVERYRGFKVRNERPEYPAMLLGLSNADNRRLGFEVEPPRLIGDPTRCQAVMAGGTDKPLLNVEPLQSAVSRIQRPALVERVLEAA